MVGVDLGAVLAGAFDGRFGSFVFNASGDLVDAFFAEAPMNGSTVLLPVAASSLGMSEDAHNKFRYSTTGFSVLGPQFDVVAGNPRFRPWAPTSSQGDFIPLGSRRIGPAHADVVGVGEVRQHARLDGRGPRRRQRRGAGQPGPVADETVTEAGGRSVDPPGARCTRRTPISRRPPVAERPR